MKIGTLCYATDQGLGILAKAFYDHGVITHPMIVRHGHHHTHDEWYPDAPAIGNLNNLPWICDYVSNLDAMLFFETPFNWAIIDYCKSVGIPTVLMPMYECMPKQLPKTPDLMICPSELDLQFYPDGIHIPVPVEVKWRQRVKAQVFVHNAGHGGLKGRNGTRELYDALPYVKSSVNLILRAQERVCAELQEHNTTLKIGNVTVDYRYGTEAMENLWEEGDVFVFPEKFNGLSLPLQEAYAAGMLVMATDRFPINRWLPQGPLIRAQESKINSISGRCNNFRESIISPHDIAKKIDEWYNLDISAFSNQGHLWARSMSWDVLKPRYMQALEQLILKEKKP